MSSSLLPSYQEATTRIDWLHLIAPYVALPDHAALCLVNGRFWDIFAPRLWRDLLRSVRLCGLDPSDDLTWWLDFVFTKLPTVRPRTQALVRVLDARAFARDAYHFASDESERTLQESFRRAFKLLPNAECVLLDDHPDLDPGVLITAAVQDHSPRLLSFAACPYQLPGTFFTSPSLQRLVYLDLSAVPGSILPLLQPGLVPELRMLKLRNRELDDVTFIHLVKLFKLRLWSLDIGHNRITDAVLDTFREKCFPVTQLRSEAHSRVEGKAVIGQYGTVEHGPFVSIEESENSGAFNHPERYFVDSPMYMARPDQGPQEYHAFRSRGRDVLHKDTADVASAALSKDLASRDDFARFRSGITHFHCSNNMISAAGMEKLLRISNGQLEEISCESMPFLPPSSGFTTIWPRGSSLQGIVGAAHVFRPVFSPNLRVLRIHHSHITNIPTLHLEGLSTLSRLFVAETSIFPRIEQAYPQTFTPDMNPRLYSLTLTHIPRRTSGPLLAKLTLFLKLLSLQERAIQDTRVNLSSSSWRAPELLQGLRHLRLEFEPDPLQDGFSALDDLDAEELLSSGDRGFSFFEDERTFPRASEQRAIREAGGHSSSASPHSVRDDEAFLTSTGVWNGNTFQIPVWIGKALAPNAFLATYRRLAVIRAVNESDADVGPATSAQVVAGVPSGSYVSHTAWRLAVMPDRLEPPSTAELSGMKDVLDGLRAYRLQGRAAYEERTKKCGPREEVLLGAPHFFWTGRLEVQREDPAARTRSSQYWR